jgi:hypothetical protein
MSAIIGVERPMTESACAACAAMVDRCPDSTQWYPANGQPPARVRDFVVAYRPSTKESPWLALAMVGPVG